MAAHTTTGGGLASEPSAPVLSNPSMGDEPTDVPVAAVAHMVTTGSDGLGAWAYCSCGGWDSPDERDEVAAVAAGIEHVEAEARLPDGLDGLITRLLDVCDDVSALVVWLAENWSADLPVPTIWRPCGTRALDVGVYCDSPAELARIAEVMGTEIVETRILEDREFVRRYARRRFGGVVIEAYRYDQ